MVAYFLALHRSLLLVQSSAVPIYSFVGGYLFLQNYGTEAKVAVARAPGPIIVPIR